MANHVVKFLHLLRRVGNLKGKTGIFFIKFSFDCDSERVVYFILWEMWKELCEKYY